MVRSKEVPKKPKDPLLTPPSKPRGFGFRDDGGFGGSLPRNRGGAAMSSPAAPASVPNYMRATSSSGAKAGQRQRAGAPSSASTPTRQRRPVRVVPTGKVLFPSAPAAAVPGMVRSTCSSTLKEAKFPSALDLAPGATDAEGPAAMRVCPYTYCSLNGHAHAPAVPLRSFLASRRRLIKTQQSMKHKGVSAFRRGTTGHPRPEDKNVVCAGAVVKVAPPLVDEDALGDFFVEVYTGPRVSSDMSCSDMSLDEMDATVRRMEFVVFDRCGADDGNDKGNDLGVHGDGERRPEGRPGDCRDSSSECSDAGISGNLVEELPWIRYQGYECDSLDDDVSEEQGVIIHEQIGEAEVLAQGQEGEDEEGKSGGLGDEREEEADEEKEPEGEEIISDLPRETGIIAAEEGDDCRVDTMYQQEASTGDQECVSDLVDKMEIASEQACVVCTVEVCKKQEEKDDHNIMGNVCDGQGTSEEELSGSVCESEIPEYEVAERVENILEDSCQDENSADQEAADDETNMDSAGKLEVTEEQKDDESEMEISETVPDVASKEDFFEQEATSEAVSEGEISDSSAVGSPDVEISNEQTEGGFEQDVSTVVEDAFEQFDTTAEDTVSGTEDAQKGLDITTCKLEDASKEPGITQESSQDFNSLCVDAPAQMEPEITEREPQDSSEESSISQESSQSNNSAHVDICAETEPEFTTCQSKDPSEECGIDHDDNSAYLGEGAEMQLGNVTSELEDTSEDDNSAYVSYDDAQNDSEITTYELAGASESVTVQEADQDHNCADVSGGAQNESELTPSELANAYEGSDVSEEAVRDGNTANVNDGPQKELESLAFGSEHAHEEMGITQEVDEDDYTAGVCAGALKETQTCKTKDACEEVCIAEEANLIAQITEQNYDLSATDGHAEPQNLPAVEDTDAKEFSVDDMCSVFSGMNLKGDIYVDPTESEISPRKRLIIARRRRTPEEDEHMRGFNPRAPNFLPLELDPDSEKVDLKHQTAEDRKNAEEWMIDYALRRAVNNLGGRKKKVSLLVQAFETVLPHDEDEKKNITPTRPVQACN